MNSCLFLRLYVSFNVTMDKHTSIKHMATLELELVILGPILGKCSPKECMGNLDRMVYMLVSAVLF